MAQATPAPSPLNDLTSFQRDLLAVVAGMNEPCGLDVKDEIEAVYESEINHGRLYPNMDELVDKGLISKEKADRRTNAYSITARGNRELAAHQAWTEQAMEADS